MSNLPPENSENKTQRVDYMSDLNKIIEDLSSLTVAEAAEPQNNLKKNGE